MRTLPTRRNIGVTIVFVLALVIISLVALVPSGGLSSMLTFSRSIDPVIYWLCVMALMVIVLGWIGYATNQHLLGILIDSKNMMSLSRLQVTLWTVLVLSAYLMFAIPRIFSPMTPMDKLAENDRLKQQCLEGKPAGFTATMEGCGGGPLQITFPPELVLAMGISLASFAGSHLIQSTKANQTIDLTSRSKKVEEARQKLTKAEQELETATTAARAPADKFSIAQGKYDKANKDLEAAPQDAPNRQELEAEKRRAQLDLDTARTEHEAAVKAQDQRELELNAASEALDQAEQEEQAARTQAEGVLHKNDNPAQAHLSEIFRGAEISNYTQVDMGKVQMFFFTVIVLLAYGAAITALLHNGNAILHPLGLDFPPFSSSLNALLAISHGAYLTAKATVQS